MKPGAGLPQEKKPKGALAALVVGAPSSPTPDEGAETDHGFRAVAKAFGIPPEREAAAKDALKQYIKACMASPSDEMEEEY